MSCIWRVDSPPSVRSVASRLEILLTWAHGWTPANFVRSVSESIFFVAVSFIFHIEKASPFFAVGSYVAISISPEPVLFTHGIPCTPWFHWRPWIPWAHVAPIGQVDPVDPMGHTLPVAPVAPVDPVAPIGPIAPIAHWIPCGHTVPIDTVLTFSIELIMPLSAVTTVATWNNVASTIVVM